jgi:hypothetical protein
MPNNFLHRILKLYGSCRKAFPKAKGKLQICKFQVYSPKCGKRNQSQPTVTITRNLIPFIPISETSLIVKKHTPWPHVHKLNISGLKQLKNVPLCTISGYITAVRQPLVASICNGKLWIKWKNIHPILTCTLTSSIFHVPCLTRWTNPVNHILSLLTPTSEIGRTYTTDLGRKQPCITLLKRFQEKCS